VSGEQLNKYQQDGSVETLRVEVATWSGKLQDFINRWHDENAYNVATEALERLQGLLPALEQFGDVNGFVTNTLKNAKENVEKANKNIPLAKARIESRPLVELVRKSREKLTDFISRPHVESYFNTAMEGLEELAALVPALEAYVADSSVDDLIKSTKGQIAKAEALVSAAKSTTTLATPYEYIPCCCGAPPLTGIFFCGACVQSSSSRRRCGTRWLLPTPS
jgi:hypothetical protein